MMLLVERQIDSGKICKWDFLEEILYIVSKQKINLIYDEPKSFYYLCVLKITLIEIYNLKKKNHCLIRVGGKISHMFFVSKDEVLSSLGQNFLNKKCIKVSFIFPKDFS